MKSGIDDQCVRQGGAIALVTTCKGRLGHLKETLPQWIQAKPAQIIVVDYGCPEGTAAWVRENFPTVTLVRIDDDPGFNASRARNIGAKAVTTEWVAFVDADIRMSADWLRVVERELESGCYFRSSRSARKKNPDLTGTFICQKTAFDRAGGYDEVFRGWGYEDEDLYFRLLILADQAEKTYPEGYLDPIPHLDVERTKFQNDPAKQMRATLNRYYFETKRCLLQIAKKNIPLEIRKKIFSDVAAFFYERRFVLKRSTPPSCIKVQVSDFPEHSTAYVKISNSRRYFMSGPRKIRVRCKIIRN